MLHFLTVTSMAKPIKATLLTCHGWTLFTGCPNISHTPASTDTVLLFSEATKVLFLFEPQK